MTRARLEDLAQSVRAAITDEEIVQGRSRTGDCQGSLGADRARVDGKGRVKSHALSV